MDTGNPSQRGRWLCSVFNDYDIVFIDGATCFGPESGKYTSFQGKTVIRRTVINYAACSHKLFSSVKAFAVADQDSDHDYAALSLEIELDVGEQYLMLDATPCKKRKIDVSLPDTRHACATLRQMEGRENIYISNQNFWVGYIYSCSFTGAWENLGVGGRGCDDGGLYIVVRVKRQVLSDICRRYQESNQGATTGDLGQINPSLRVVGRWQCCTLREFAVHLYSPHKKIFKGHRLEEVILKTLRVFF
jgi:hypothetical protein